MSEQEWKTVNNKKVKKDKTIIIPNEILRDPIISRQKEAISKINAQNQNNNKIKYDGPKDPNQDWNNLILTKTKQKLNVSLPQKPSTSIKENTITGDVSIKKVSKSMAKSIIDARLLKKWTQLQLAQNSTVDVKTINEIERSGCVYNANIFNKLCKALGVKIERNYDTIKA